MTKAQIRREMLARRRGMTAAEVAARSLAIYERFIELPELRGCDACLSYVSHNNEVVTLKIINNDEKRFKQILIPRMADAAYLHWVEFQAMSALVPGSYGLLEPSPDTTPVAKIPPKSVCIVPCVAFRRDGHRLGFGVGCFDRFLSSFDGIAIGFAYDFQEAPKLPVEEHDVPLAMIVAESAAYRREPSQITG